MSLGKKDILAEEKRTGKRLLDLRRGYNRSVLSGGGDIMDISCKIDPAKKIKINGYENYDVYECKDKNKKILQDYKIKQLFRENEENLLKRLSENRQSFTAELREKDAEVSRMTHNNQLLLKKFRKMKEIEKRNDILKGKLLKESQNSYQLHGELIKMRQDNEEYRNRVLKFYEKMEKQDKIKRDAIMKGRELALKQTLKGNIKKIMRKHIQDAENAMAEYYIKKLDRKEKYHKDETENQLKREDELLKQLEDVKAQLDDANDAWSKYTTHIVETTQKEIDQHIQKREELRKMVDKI